MIPVIMDFHVVTFILGKDATAVSYFSDLRSDAKNKTNI